MLSFNVTRPKHFIDPVTEKTVSSEEIGLIFKLRQALFEIQEIVAPVSMIIENTASLIMLGIEINL